MRWNVLELAADPWGWQSELQEWERRFGARRVVEWNTANRSHMGPATDRLASLVLEGRLRHDGDPRLAAHVANAVPVTTAHGDVIVKDKRMSPRKIDAAVAAIIAVDRAAQVKPRKRGITVLS
jgi:phage terminase large subunit-like protein